MVVSLAPSSPIVVSNARTKTPSLKIMIVYEVHKYSLYFHAIYLFFKQLLLLHSVNFLD